MSPQPAGSGSRWRSGRALRLHAALAVAVAVTGTGGWVELHRALAGHRLGWAYAVEWPVIGAFSAVLWWRLLTEPQSPGGRAGPPPGAAGRPGRWPAKSAIAPDDPQLLAWQAYLADLHAADPPGAPPSR